MGDIINFSKKSFDSTYKELKREKIAKESGLFCTFDSTYKELKLRYRVRISLLF